MASFSEQLPALIGVLLGAGATFGATFATDRARWHRDQSVRWDVKRADAYAEYAFAVKRIISLAVCIAAHRGAHSLGEPLSPDEGTELLADAEHERAVKWETVLLLIRKLVSYGARGSARRSVSGAGLPGAVVQAAGWRVTV
jgi:hypothetical protein